MTPSASPRVTAYAALAALFLFAALAIRQPELAIIAAPFALLPALGLVLTRPPEPRVWLTLERPTALEQDELQRGGRPSISGATSTRQQQLALFQAPAETHPVVTKLRDLDLDRMTPIDALNVLASLKREADS